MAHTKAKSAAKNNRDSEAKRLGIKRFEGERVLQGDIIVRQRGTRIYPGFGVRRGGDDTLYAVISGVVKFGSKKKPTFDGARGAVKIVSVVK